MKLSHDLNTGPKATIMSSAGLPQWRLQAVSFTQTFRFEFVEFSRVKSTLSFFSTLFFLAFLVYLQGSFISSSIHNWFVVSVPPSSYGCTWKFARLSSVWQLPMYILNLRWRATLTAKSIWSWQKSYLSRDSNDVVLARTVLRKPIHHGGDSTVLLKTFCANCGFTLPDGANFCVQCEKRMFIIHLQVHTVHIWLFFPGKFSNHVQWYTKYAN